MSKTYRYDKALNTVETQAKSEKRTFRLNRNNQITAVYNQNGEQERYAYDECGYLTQQAQGITLGRGSHEDERHVQHQDIYQQGHKLNRLNQHYYTYDKAGRLTEKTEIRDGFRQKTTYYRWNASNQLTGITNDNGEVWYYQYDALGRRISKECPQQSLKIQYLWDGDQLAYTQTVKNGKLNSQRHSVFNGWQLIAQQDSYQTLHQSYEGNKYKWQHQTGYAVCQPNGQVLALLNPKGRTLWRKEKLTLWGLFFPNDYRKSSQLDPQMLFAGQWLDEESGLAYNRFRYYDPESGNYISSDPIGLAGGETPYGYVHNPVGWIDPFGLARCHGLPSTRKAGGTGKNYDPVNGQGLYVLKDPLTNEIKYVGRGDAYARGISHSASIDKNHLTQEILAHNNLTKAEAKYLEQKLMDHLGGAKSTNPLTNLMNKIRSYSPSNPNSGIYNIAGDSASWGKEILDYILSKL